LEELQKFGDPVLALRPPPATPLQIAATAVRLSVRTVGLR
jgi:hypothetical protein